jgi:hypothetical protein
VARPGPLTGGSRTHTPVRGRTSQAGAGPGLQNRCVVLRGAAGGFDSPVLPPFTRTSPASPPWPSLGWGQRGPMQRGNVARVHTRHHGMARPISSGALGSVSIIPATPLPGHLPPSSSRAYRLTSCEGSASHLARLLAPTPGMKGVIGWEADPALPVPSGCSSSSPAGRPTTPLQLRVAAPGRATAGLLRRRVPMPAPGGRSSGALVVRGPASRPARPSLGQVAQGSPTRAGAKGDVDST